MRSQPIAAEGTAECPSPIPLDQFLVSLSLTLSPTIFMTAIKKEVLQFISIYIQYKQYDTLQIGEESATHQK